MVFCVWLLSGSGPPAPGSPEKEHGDAVPLKVWSHQRWHGGRRTSDVNWRWHTFFFRLFSPFLHYPGNYWRTKYVQCSQLSGFGRHRGLGTSRRVVTPHPAPPNTTLCSHPHHFCAPGTRACGGSNCDAKRQTPTSVRRLSEQLYPSDKTCVTLRTESTPAQGAAAQSVAAVQGETTADASRARPAR
eukprot:gene16682-biopygen21819